MKRHNAWIFAAMLVGCAGCDHATKQIAQDALSGSSPISLAGDTLRLELASNPGGFLSLGAGLPAGVRGVLFFVLVPLGLAVLCGLVLRASVGSAASLLGLGMLAGGGVGNWLDRLAHDGAVTDFVSLGWGPLQTGIFNLADVTIVAGVALLLLGERGRSSRFASRDTP